MSNGDTWHSAIPVKVKTIVFVVSMLGVGPGVAGFFMAQQAGWIGSVGGRNTARLDRMIAMQERSLENHLIIIKENQRLVTALNFALEILCINAAKDEQARSNCRLISRGEKP